MQEELSFKYGEARSLPVILLLDTSGSMSASGNINTLNSAVREMLQDFAGQDDNNISIQVAIYTFGPSPKQFLPLTPAKDALEQYNDMPASGMTPLGGVLNMAKQELIERKEILTSRSYRPTVILVSDGAPNDVWEPALNAFVNEGRSSKCYRMAMGIGISQGSPEYQVLEKFVSDKEQVFSADQSKQIKNFFKYVTISTISRTKSANPNVIPAPVSTFDDDDDDVF